MLCREVRAAKAVATLLALGIKTANEMSTEEACRVHARAQRGARSTGRTKPLALLVAESSKRRRARITHPGKRFR